MNIESSDGIIEYTIKVSSLYVDIITTESITFSTASAIPVSVTVTSFSNFVIFSVIVAGKK